MSGPKISVIIPARNEADNIQECLEAIFSQSYPPYEVLVVDGNSTDDTVEKAKAYPVIILCEDAHSKGFACQIGVENATGEYIAFINSDCIPRKDWLASLVREFRDGIVGVGGTAKLVDTGDGFWGKYIALTMQTALGSANSIQWRTFRDKRLVKSIAGCSSMYRARDIAEVGGFSAELADKMLGGQDLELNNRLLKIGNLLYTPHAIVTHRHPWTFKSYADKMFHYGRERGFIMAWDLQAIPPLVAPFLLLLLLINYKIILPLLGVYLILLAAAGIKLAFQERAARCLLYVPVVYVCEHVSYLIGFWEGFLERAWLWHSWLPGRSKIAPDKARTDIKRRK
jgi:glycosyltransferase involved in cell wall biosynthesis